MYQSFDIRVEYPGRYGDEALPADIQCIVFCQQTLWVIGEGLLIAGFFIDHSSRTLRILYPKSMGVKGF
ncbi:MAG TPA: hypothetical protein VKA68_11120, partial [bacterium]|nr:hypothetical protein [bacterium]